MVYFAIGRFAWGKGKTAREALKNMRANVAENFRNKYIIYSTTDEGAYVDSMRGDIHSNSPVIEVERVGIKGTK